MTIKKLLSLGITSLAAVGLLGFSLPAAAASPTPSEQTTKVTDNASKQSAHTPKNAASHAKHARHMKHKKHTETISTTTAQKPAATTK